MARITAKGSAQYLRDLEKLGRNTDDICKQAVYQGAKVVADAIKSSIDDITVHSLPPGQKYFYLSEEDKKGGKLLDGVTKEQADGLKNGLGIAVMEHKNFAWNTKIGFNGYNEVRTKTYPKGQPNVLIAISVENGAKLAREVESGTSIRKKTPFIAPTVKKIRKDAEHAMEVTIEEKIHALIDE